MAGLSLGSLLLLATAANPLAQIPGPLRLAMVAGAGGGAFGVALAKNRLADINAEREGWLMAKAHQTAAYNHTRLQSWQAFQYHLDSIVEGAKEAITDTVEQVQERRELDRMEAATGPKLLDWADLRNGDRFPHFALYGGTGDGKSYTANLLLRFLGQPAIVVNPHHKPGDFPGYPVVGEGRRYAECAEFLKGLHRLMDERYKQRAVGQEDYEPVNVILDEYNAIARTMPKAEREEFQRVMGDLISEARKVRIRLIILAQSDRVKSWGFENMGDLLDSCHWLYLRSVVHSAKPSKALQYWLGEGEYRAALATPSGAIGADIAELNMYSDRPAIPYHPQTGGDDARSRLERLWAGPTAPDAEPIAAPKAAPTNPEDAILSYLEKRGQKGATVRQFQQAKIPLLSSFSASDIRANLDILEESGEVIQKDGIYFLAE